MIYQKSFIALSLLCLISLEGYFCNVMRSQEMFSYARIPQMASESEMSLERSRRDTRSIRSKRYTISNIDTILNLCNSLRRLQGASNMFKMIWDSQLAEAAGLWVDQCTWQHGYPAGFPYPAYTTDVGEAMYATTMSNLNVSAAIQAWYNQVRYYNYSGSCNNDSVCGACLPGKDCGMYTQVVWWNSFHVGCAYSRCSPLLQSGWGSTAATFFLCYFAPPGNEIGQHPYEKGEPCTACGADPNAYYCDQGLCVNEDVPATTAAAPMNETTSAAHTTTVLKETPTVKVQTTSQNQETTTTARITTSSAKPATTASQKETTTMRTTIAVKETTTAPKTTVTLKETTLATKTTIAEIKETTTKSILTTEAVTTAKPSTCGDQSCPNACALTNQTCCACRTYTFYRDCTCCPLNYLCCPFSPFFPRGAGCCPPGSACNGDGSCTFTFGTNTETFPGRGTTYTTTAICPTDPTLVITADNFISELYLDGDEVPSTMLPNRYYPDVLDIVPLPKTVKVIAVMAVNFVGVGGILARSTDGRASKLSSWRCMDYTLTPPPNGWMNETFDDSLWNYSAVYFRDGVIKPGYPFYSLAPLDAQTEWIWASSASHIICCRLTLP